MESDGYVLVIKTGEIVINRVFASKCYKRIAKDERQKEITRVQREKKIKRRRNNYG